MLEGLNGLMDDAGLAGRPRSIIVTNWRATLLKLDRSGSGCSSSTYGENIGLKLISNRVSGSKKTLAQKA